MNNICLVFDVMLWQLIPQRVSFLKDALCSNLLFFSLLFKVLIFAFVAHLLVPMEAIDICSIKTQNAEDCREICLRSVYCRYFTYVTNWKTCHLKVTFCLNFLLLLVWVFWISLESYFIGFSLRNWFFRELIFVVDTQKR